MTRGTYQTRQQDAVEAFFSSHEQECLSAEEAYQRLLDGGCDIGKTTVYRVITRLFQAGRLRRYAAGERGEPARYQYNPCQESHLHIRCINCGTLEHLHCEEVEAFASHLTCHHGFTLDESQTILYGCCKNCQKQPLK